MRAAALTVALLLALGRPAMAQGGSPVLKWGKWTLLAGSVGMNLLAARSHDRADDVFEQIESRCSASRFLCELNTDGRYANPATESLYQQSLRYDRHARRWLIGGQTALLGAAAIFVWELTRPKRRPDNIPFEPEVTSHRGLLRIGVRSNF